MVRLRYKQTNPKTPDKTEEKKMKFTKAMVKVIEEKFNITLTDEQIAAGCVKLEYTRGFIGASTYEVEIIRIDSKFVAVTANFKNDAYKFVNGCVENAKLKNLLDRI